MSLQLLYLVLFADQERWKDLGSGFRGENAKLQFSEIVICASMVALAVIVISILARLMAKQEGGREHYSRKGIFKSLCQAHTLSRADAALLKKMAWHYQQPDPAQLFLTPAKFQAGVLPAALREQKEQIEALSRRLFRPTT